MTCNEVQALVAADPAARFPDEVVAHLTTCAECRGFAAFALRAWRHPGPEAPVVSLHQVRERERRARRRVVVWRRAAGFLVVLGMVWAIGTWKRPLVVPEAEAGSALELAWDDMAVVWAELDAAIDAEELAMTWQIQLADNE